MKHVMALTLCALLCYPAISQADETLGFDDITDGAFGAVPYRYGGLIWEQVGVVHTPTYSSSGYHNGVTSPEYVAYNQLEFDASIEVASLYSFDFTGAYFMAAWNDGLQIDIKGYRDDQEIYSQTLTVHTSDSTWVALDYTDIDRVTFSSYGGTNAGLGASGTYFGMDDMTIVPEPAIPGDADLDHAVGPEDLATLGLHWGPGSTGATWAEGDFDGDGMVANTDLATLGLNWYPQLPVPEPTSLSVLFISGIFLIRRK